VIFSHSVNGVSALHTSILEHSVLKDFYATVPENFTTRPMAFLHAVLANANPAYSGLIW
jgi:starch phosphorylase